jgi:regulator of cell morphogenesis and NO signaling
MLLTSEKTVGEIAAGIPAAARVFEKYRIDYCCGGRQSLEAACEGKGVSPAEVLSELEAATRSPEDRDWTNAPLAELADHIVARHHAFLRAELPALDQRLAKVIEAHPGHRDSLLPLRDTFQALRFELMTHMMKEERILFPLVKRMEEAALAGAAPPAEPCGSVNNPIRVMEYEHDSAAAALREMRRITGDYSPPPDACATYRALFDGLQALEADLHLHIHLENNILFPRAGALEARRA